MHRSRSPFIALAVTATIGRSLHAGTLRISITLPEEPLAELHESEEPPVEPVICVGDDRDAARRIALGDPAQYPRGQVGRQARIGVEEDQPAPARLSHPAGLGSGEAGRWLVHHPHRQAAIISERAGERAGAVHRAIVNDDGFEQTRWTTLRGY